MMNGRIWCLNGNIGQQTAKPIFMQAEELSV